MSLINQYTKWLSNNKFRSPLNFFVQHLFKTNFFGESLKYPALIYSGKADQNEKIVTSLSLVVIMRGHKSL